MAKIYNMLTESERDRAERTRALHATVQYALTDLHPGQPFDAIRT